MKKLQKKNYGFFIVELQFFFAILGPESTKKIAVWILFAIQCQISYLKKKKLDIYKKFGRLRLFREIELSLSNI